MRTEAVIPTKVIAPTHRATIEESNNNLERYLDLVLAEKLRDKSRIHVKDQKWVVGAYHDTAIQFIVLAIEE